MDWNASAYDRWLTTDTAGDEAEAYAEWVVGEWETYAETNRLPYAMADEDDPDHAVYAAWEASLFATQAYHDKLQADAEWAAAEESDRAQAEWEAHEAAEAERQYRHDVWADETYG